MTEVLVIGGGAIGLAIAWQLIRTGSAVRVIDAGPIARGASWAAAGMLAPAAEAEFHEDDALALALSSQRLWPAFAADLAADAGFDVELDTTGTLLVALDRDDDERLRRELAWRSHVGLEGRRIDGDEARALEPLLSPAIPTAVHCPGDWSVSNRRLVDALAAACRALGVVFEANTRVRRIDVHAGAVTGVTLDTGEARVGSRVVLAAGAWSRDIEGLRPLRAPIRPVRGQMLALRPLAGEEGPRHVLRSREAYLVPKRDGQVVVGATSEERGFDPSLTAGGVFTLLRGAWETMPASWEWTLTSTWTGFRPASRDNRPLLGGCSIDGLFFAVGHHRNGIQLTPVTALGVAACVRGERPPAELAGFDAERFRIPTSP